MSKNPSRRELQTQVEALNRALNLVRNILYKHDRMIAFLLKNDPAFSTGWSYTPTITVASNHNSSVPLSGRNAPASSFEAPTLQKMADHIMTANLLEP